MPSRKKSPLSKPKDSTVELEGVDSWAEIYSTLPHLTYEEPAEGDLTKKEFAAHERISIQAAKARMDKLVATGKWRWVTIKGGYGERPRVAIRKV